MEIIKTSSTFCTCKDYDCENNPRNHDEGCNKCVESSVEDREIPVCFFNSISEKDADEVTDFSYKGFADFVMAHS